MKIADSGLSYARVVLKNKKISTSKLQDLVQESSESSGILSVWVKSALFKKKIFFKFEPSLKKLLINGDSISTCPIKCAKEKFVMKYLKLVSAFHQFFFTKWYSFKNNEKCFFISSKKQFSFWDIQTFVSLFSPFSLSAIALEFDPREILNFMMSSIV